MLGHRKKLIAMLAGREDVAAEYALLNIEQLGNVFLVRLHPLRLLPC